MTKHQPVGKTGLALPKIVFGATSLGNLFHQPTDEEKRAIVRAWLNSGVSPVVIDSAGKYGAGLSLEVIGRELEAAGVDASQVMISNKLGWRRIPLATSEPTFEPGVWRGIEHDAVQDIGYDGILRCWEEGNALLGNYQANLVSVHDPDEYLGAAGDAADRGRRLDDIVQAYRALCELRDAGRVLAVGVGAKNWKVIKELSALCDFDWVMFANSFTILEHPPELVTFIQELAGRGVTIINSALFHGGFLLGGEFYNYRRLDASRAADAELLRARQRLQQACEQAGRGVFEVGVAFGMSHPGIAAVALSSSRAERVPRHVASVELELPQEVWKIFKAQGVIAAGYPFVASDWTTESSVRASNDN